MRQPLSLLATFAALAALALAGCGGSSSNSAASSGDGSSTVDAKGAAHQPEPTPYPHVLISTTAGDITVKLDHEKAQLTVENFLHYVDEGFYTDTIFHAVRRDDVIIGGGYTRDLKEKPAGRQPIRNEARNGLKNVRGTIAMVREPNVIDSSTSQFFFNVNLADKPNDYLDPQPLKPDERPEQFPDAYGYCVFGEVVEGMDVLDQISKLEVSDNCGAMEFLPKRMVVITEVKRVK
jgi:peptidyl-prolyl cis-trans isomerase A (cyclophilin A)